MSAPAAATIDMLAGGDLADQPAARAGRTRQVTKTVSFANGGEIPVIGFGTWQITGQTCVDAVRTALRSDYRHVDTATMYGNEAEVGAAWQDSGLPRDDVFLTTKLPPRLAGKARGTLGPGGDRPLAHCVPMRSSRGSELRCRGVAASG